MATGWIIFYSTLHVRRSLISEIRNLFGWIFAFFLLIFITKITYLFTSNISLDLQHLVLSVVWIVYAIGLIIFGFVTNVRKARLAGVSFLLIILLKIIFVDLPDLSIAIRAVLFIGLGGIGLVVSRLFLQNKKRNEVIHNRKTASEQSLYRTMYLPDSPVIMSNTPFAHRD